METLRVFIATSNSGKLRELKDLFAETFPGPRELVGRAPLDCEETADSFLGNARIKADHLTNEILAEKSGPRNFWVLADDSGLCVDALGGRPGIHTARYAGPNQEPAAHMKKLIAELQASGARKPWSAHYHCALVLNRVVDAQIFDSLHGEGKCYGEIVEEARGGSGFGYDPIFLFTEIGLRFSELDEREKNRRSHRKAAYVSLAQAVESSGLL